MGKRLSTSTDVDSTTQNEKDSESESYDLEQVVRKKHKKAEEYHCLYENEDAYGGTPMTIFVRGFDCSLPMADIRSTLRKHFNSCGVISRIFVPAECKTGSLLGFALLNILPDKKKALALDESYLGNLKLEVGCARSLIGSRKYPNFIGCERCVRVQRTRLFERFIETRGGLIQRRSALLDSMVAESDQKAGRKPRKAMLDSTVAELDQKDQED
ncbi:PREDICTED: uncharacterized protein LOC104779636 [Camelina sativa]|uniref:Uncharacterized protein LOC104779636 n=1 Tax=Camelina sativa TaxID=90675 RepID=A0ABM0YKB5_CAMSA|nr:PREDICTED: uncharacterized protein LOC104779636 [Camelina sativa]